MTQAGVQATIEPVIAQKTQIDILNAEFSRIHERSCELAALIPERQLFVKPALGVRSSGENLLRSAAAVEQTFGGIMARLWDDPFEWTLPEELDTNEKVLEYLNEVESTRNKGFVYFKSDVELSRLIPAPIEYVSLFELLLQTISRASYFQGRAEAVYLLVSAADL